MDLPDAPWIVESWYTGNDPDYQETPWDRSSPNGFVEGADADYGWRILAWQLDIDADTCDESAMQSVWEDLTEKARKSYCKAFTQYHRDDAEDLYNQYWREWRA